MKRVDWKNAFIHKIRPEFAVAVMGLACGLIFLFAAPPFDVPDEPQYFYHAYHLSELRVFNMVYLNRKEKAKNDFVFYGALLPKSLARVVDESEIATTRFRQDSKVSREKIIRSLGIPLNPDEREYLPVAPYPVVSYIPQAIGIAIGRLFRLPPLVLFYMARMAALSAWLGSMYLTIRTTPILKWAYFLLALMPMTLHLAASNSGDSVTISLGFLMSATLFKWAYDPEKIEINWRDVAWLSVIAAGLGLSKAGYLSLTLLFFLTPSQKFEAKKRYHLSFLSIIGVGLAASYLWSTLVPFLTAPGPSIDLARHAVDSTPFSGVSRNGQLAFVFHHPSAFVDVLWTTIAVLRVFLVNSFIGLLGWLNTWLPQWLIFLYAAALFTAGLSSGSYRSITDNERVLSATVFSMSTVIAFLSIYMIVDTVGAPVIEGFQGRYLIPFAPVLLHVFHRNRPDDERQWVRPAMFVMLAGVAALVAGEALIHRFY